MGLMTQFGSNPSDPGVFPSDKRGSVCLATATSHDSGELSAGEANDEVAPNAGDGVVLAAEIPFHLSANPIPMDDEAGVREMARNMGEHGHERGHQGDRSGGIDTSTADAPGMSQTEKRRSWWQNNRSNPAY